MHVRLTPWRLGPGAAGRRRGCRRPVSNTAAGRCGTGPRRRGRTPRVGTGRADPCRARPGAWPCARTSWWPAPATAARRDCGNAGARTRRDRSGAGAAGSGRDGGSTPRRARGRSRHRRSCRTPQQLQRPLLVVWLHDEVRQQVLVRAPLVQLGEALRRLVQEVDSERDGPSRVMVVVHNAMTACSARESHIRTRLVRGIPTPDVAGHGRLRALRLRPAQGDGSRAGGRPNRRGAGQRACQRTEDRADSDTDRRGSHRHGGGNRGRRRVKRGQ